MKREPISTTSKSECPQNVEPGLSYPLGAQLTADGVNFCFYSRHCSAVDLLLFDTADAEKPCQVVRLDPVKNKTFHYWHVFVRGLTEGQVYGLRAQGPFEPEQGWRFDPGKVLLDPYSRAVVNWQNYSRELACRPGDNCSQSLRSVVIDCGKYNWEQDAPLRTPYARSVIYELHIKGFTSNPNSGVSPEKRGTFAGLMEKIPYLQELGVTAVELMPVFQFDEQDAVSGLKNYWGYSPIVFFAPHGDYSSRKDPLGAVEEFKDMVKALHRAGIEVILDVVFNHTAEGNELGPTLSYKGLDNSTYYMLEENPAFYADYSGCGNTFKANSPVCQKLIMDCLHYWVSEMHVDGFRFDLASILSRDVFGKPQSIKLPGILSVMEADPILAGTKLIAEAWDGAGLYQVGAFINDGDWFAEWNGPFRDDARRFIKGDNSTTKLLASRIAGSSDIYTNKDREPNRSINFVTCHDGFTLNDLVSFDRKHNEANGENNRDGTDCNWSWNCGIEGPSDNSTVETLRLKQIKNALCLLFLSQGTPMILMGDEIRRSQHGNNNAYCQDNDLSWMDWTLVDENEDLLKFTQGLVSFTQSLELFEQDHLLCGKCGHCCCPHIEWHGTTLDQPDWSDFSHSLSFLIVHPEAEEHLYVIFNAFWESLIFQLPDPPSRKQWHRIVDTAIAPVGIWTAESASPVSRTEYWVKERSSVVLMALNKGFR
ncbi:MAG: glycogen debranching protein GlgX [Candidatus Obscuribacterales bacterium]|nr:glycogen debranching protein GlgX [Candidatus Obscuribacterales bacterium]